MMSINLLSAYGWFAGLLTVMIVITVLFAVILFIALRPVSKDEIGIKQLLARREAEITADILKNKGDKAKTDELMLKLREVESAENLIKELVGDEDEQPEAKKGIFSFFGNKKSKKAPAEKGKSDK